MAPSDRLTTNLQEQGRCLVSHPLADVLQAIDDTGRSPADVWVYGEVTIRSAVADRERARHPQPEAKKASDG